MNSACTQHTKFDSWWENDAKGIPLARVCDDCIKEKLSRFDPDILTDVQQERLGIYGMGLDYTDVVTERIEADY